MVVRFSGPEQKGEVMLWLELEIVSSFIFILIAKKSIERKYRQK